MARNYEAMIDIYLEKYPVDYQILKETIFNAFIQFRMAESLDKGLQLISRITKYSIPRHRKFQATGKKEEAMELLQEAYRIAM